MNPVAICARRACGGGSGDADCSGMWSQSVAVRLRSPSDRARCRRVRPAVRRGSSTILPPCRSAFRNAVVQGHSRTSMSRKPAVRRFEGRAHRRSAVDLAVASRCEIATPTPRTRHHKPMLLTEDERQTLERRVRRSRAARESGPSRRRINEASTKSNRRPSRPKIPTS